MAVGASAIPVGGGRGPLRIVTPDQLTAQQQAQDAAQAANVNKPKTSDDVWEDALAGYIQGKFARFSRHRDSADGWTQRLTDALMAFKGQYDADMLAEINKMGGSRVYFRLIASKCRGASSLLRDLYLNADRPWQLKATPDPTLPDDVTQAITQLVQTEVANQSRLAGPPDPTQVRDRVVSLFGAAKQAAIKKAREQADAAELRVDDILVEGKFYEALGQFITDLPLFPFACIKGPTVKVVPQVTWVNGKAVSQNKAKMFWSRVSPFDLWWTPGVANIADAEVIEKSRITRVDLNQLRGVPGYDQDKIKAVIAAYGISGYVESTGANAEASRASMESRENPSMNESGMMDMLEYHGYALGQTMLDWGMSPAQVPDPTMDYFVDCFKIGRYVIKCQISQSIKKRPPYYITSFEKMPGTVIGNALPDILSDVAHITNATMRALVNNEAMSSGPQLVIREDMLDPNEDADDIYPHKRWRVNPDPAGNQTGQPIYGINIESHAQELLMVFDKMMGWADDLSAIPRYLTGSSPTGGASRTASGLAMLMGNAAKILQTVAANVDTDVVYDTVSELYDLIMLTDQTGMLRGDESIEVLGVNSAVQKETERQRQLELLQITANPIDAQIMGVKGRAELLRAVSNTVGLDGDTIVPPDDQLPTGAGGGAPPGPPGQGGPGGPGAPPAGVDPSQGGGPTGTPGNMPPTPSPVAGPQTNVVGNGG